MAKISTADFIAKFIEKISGGCVFLVSGSANLYLLGAIGRRKKLKYVCNHHEQAAAMAAEAYSRAGKHMGVCVVTTGPGGTNAITGVVGAWLDSIPVLYISGQARKENMIKKSGVRQMGIQEINIIDIVKPITKYAITVTNPEEIKYHLQKAIFLAKFGRPGPVWIDVPLDVQAFLIEEDDLLFFDPIGESFKPFDKRKLGRKIIKTIELIKKSKRPVILAGHGIKLASARAEFSKLIEQLNIPVLTSMSAHDLIISKHSLFCGRPGIFGDRSGNFAIQNADLLISIGARLHLWTIGHNPKLFARKAKKVIVDIDKAELEKPTIKADLAICADAKGFVEKLIKKSRKIKLPDISTWREKCLRWKKKYPVVLPEYKNKRRFVNPYYFISVLSGLLREGEVVVTGVGTARICVNQAIEIKKGQRLYYNTGCAAMGYDLPAAIGIYFAVTKKRIILITGEGSLMMNIQELQTIFHHKLPIKIFVLNNRSYLTIKQNRDIFFNDKLIAVDEKTGVTFPSLKKVSRAFGVPYEKINNQFKMHAKIKKTLRSSGPILCDVKMSLEQPFYPRFSLVKRPDDGIIIAKPLEDMYPYLGRQEFLDNMAN